MVDKFSKIILCFLLVILPVMPQLANYNEYLLPKTVVPIKYYINLTPHMHNDVYMGQVQILIYVTNPTNNITMHQHGLVILPEKVYLMQLAQFSENEAIIKHDGISISEKEDFYIIHFKEELQPKIYVLVISQYFGVYRTYSRRGLYAVTYFDNQNITQKLVMSFFEPTYARSAFPCFDEPELKATFKIYIIRPWNYHSASNGILIKSSYLHNLLVEDEFEETNLLSTYTITFLISNLTLSKKSENNNIHQVLARPNLIKDNKEKYSIEIIQRAFEEISKFIKTPLPIKKIYHVAIPEDKLLFQAITNWGHVTYIESAFIALNVKTIKEIELLDSIIISGLLHQWFGNLISVKWWNYLWINEGLDLYLSYNIADNLNPKWSKMQDFQIGVLHIMKIDSENNTVSLNHDCYSPKEIYFSKYNLFTYVKGAAMFRMIESILSTEIFRKGLQYYVHNRSFQAAIPDDLYRNLDRSVRDSNIKLLDSVSRIMETWDSQIGFPIVKVKRNYGFESFNVQLTQKRCMLHDTLEPKPIWHIPINYATKSNPNFYNQQPNDWLTTSSHHIKIKNLRRNDWLIINTKAAYYYRVNYDLRNWDLLSKALILNYKEIDLHNRAQIIDDAFNLASMGRIPYRIPLKISEYFFREMEYAPLKVMKNVFNFLKVQLAETPTEENFKIYFTKKVIAVYNSLANRDQSRENHAHQKPVNLIFSWLCELQHKNCVSKVDTMFKDYRDGKELPADLEEQVLCTAMKRGEETYWFYILENIQSRKEKQYRKFLALACTNNISLLERYLEFSSTRLQRTLLVKALQAVIEQGPIGFRVSFKFILQRFKSLMLSLEKNDIKIILTSLASHITTPKDLIKLTKLSNRYKQHTKTLFGPGLTQANENIQWNTKYLNEVDTYFANYDRSGTILYYNTLGINIFNILMFYVGIVILC